jgi:hypothetical protein
VKGDGEQQQQQRQRMVVVVKGRGDWTATLIIYARRVNTHHKQLASQVVFHILLIHLSPLLASAALKLAAS